MALLRRIFRREGGEPAAPRISRESPLVSYVVREHAAGRPLEDILDDPYLRNRASAEQRQRLLEDPALIRAVGEHTAAAARDRTRDR